MADDEEVDPSVEIDPSVELGLAREMLAMAVEEGEALANAAIPVIAAHHRVQALVQSEMQVAEEMVRQFTFDPEKQDERVPVVALWKAQVSLLARVAKALAGPE